MSALTVSSGYYVDSNKASPSPSNQLIGVVSPTSATITLTHIHIQRHILLLLLLFYLLPPSFPLPPPPALLQLKMDAFVLLLVVCFFFLSLPHCAADWTDDGSVIMELESSPL